MKNLSSQLGPMVEVSQLESLVNAFAKHFPKLLTQEGSFGKCKFSSYELAMYLRKRGVPARVMHVQGIQPGVYPNPHRSYAKKPRAKWSHYFVKVGPHAIDLSVRQFDTSLPYPYIHSMTEVRKQWVLVEQDKFIMRWMKEVLRHKDVA